MFSLRTTHVAANSPAVELVIVDLSGVRVNYLTTHHLIYLIYLHISTIYAITIT